jgi:hypothetical protein
MNFFPDGEVEVQPHVDDEGPASELVKVVAEMAEWNPYLVYGGLALGAFRTASSVIESLFERSCFEVARPEAVKGKTIIHKFLVFRKNFRVWQKH